MCTLVRVYAQYTDGNTCAHITAPCTCACTPVLWPRHTASISILQTCAPMQTHAGHPTSTARCKPLCTPRKHLRGLTNRGHTLGLGGHLLVRAAPSHRVEACRAGGVPGNLGRGHPCCRHPTPPGQTPGAAPSPSRWLCPPGMLWHQKPSGASPPNLSAWFFPNTCIARAGEGRGGQGGPHPAWAHSGAILSCVPKPTSSLGESLLGGRGSQSWGTASLQAPTPSLPCLPRASQLKSCRHTKVHRQAEPAAGPAAGQDGENHSTATTAQLPSTAPAPEHPTAPTPTRLPSSPAPRRTTGC